MTGAQIPAHAYLDVTRSTDGRYCVAFVRGDVRRMSYTPSVDQIVAQAQCAGNIAVRTSDITLRQRCQEAGLALIERDAEDQDAVSRLV